MKFQKGDSNRVRARDVLMLPVSVLFFGTYWALLTPLYLAAAVVMEVRGETAS